VLPVWWPSMSPAMAFVDGSIISFVFEDAGCWIVDYLPLTNYFAGSG
jgi:hypothetical protein